MSALVLWALLCAGSAEGDKYNWYQGSVTMTNGEVISNRLAIVHSHETILIKKQKGCKVIPAYKIASFNYYDPQKKAYRDYKVITGRKKGIKNHKFYEIINTGKVEILRRVQSELYKDRVLNSVSRIWISNGKQLEAYDYFVHINDEIVSLDRFKKDILPYLLQDNEESIKSLIKDRKLRLETLGHRVVVIMYYNLIAEQAAEFSLTSLD